MVAHKKTNGKPDKLPGDQDNLDNARKTGRSELAEVDVVSGYLVTVVI